MAKKDRIVVVAAVFKILADPTRCRIVHVLVRNPKGMYVFEIAESAKVSQSAVSHQLAVLARFGLVKSMRRGQMIRYTLLRSPKTNVLLRALEGLYKHA